MTDGKATCLACDNVNPYFKRRDVFSPDGSYNINFHCVCCDEVFAVCFVASYHQEELVVVAMQEYRLFNEQGYETIVFWKPVYHNEGDRWVLLFDAMSVT